MRKPVAIYLSAIACATAHAASAVDETEGYVLIEDEAGNPLYAGDAEGREVTFVYDENGSVIATIDQDGVVTDWQQHFAESGDGSEQ